MRLPCGLCLSSVHPWYPPDPPSSAAFDDPSADLILISSDNIEFRVHRVILALASPVFRTMLSLPQPQLDGAAEGKNEELPRVPVGESAVILEGMLRFWYPGATQPHISSITQLNEILEAMIIKYEMEFIIPTAKYRLRDFVVSEPLASFAVAARYDWNDVALEAAKETLKLPLRQTLYPLSIEWRRVNGTVHHALTQYHQLHNPDQEMFFSKIVLLAGVVAHGALAMPSDIESRATQFTAQQQAMISLTGSLAGNCSALQSLVNQLPANSGNALVAQTVEAAAAKAISCIMPSSGQLIPSAGGILGGILGGGLGNLGNLPVNGILGGCILGTPGLLGGLTGSGLTNILGGLIGSSDIIGALGPAGSLLGQLGNLNNILSGNLLGGLLGPGGNQVAELVDATTEIINNLEELGNILDLSCGCGNALIADLVALLNETINLLLQLLDLGATGCATTDLIAPLNQLEKLRRLTERLDHAFNFSFTASQMNQIRYEPPLLLALRSWKSIVLGYHVVPPSEAYKAELESLRASLRDEIYQLHQDFQSTKQQLLEREQREAGAKEQPVSPARKREDKADLDGYHHEEGAYPEAPVADEYRVGANTGSISNSHPPLAGDDCGPLALADDMVVDETPQIITASDVDMMLVNIDALSEIAAMVPRSSLHHSAGRKRAREDDHDCDASACQCALAYKDGSSELLRSRFHCLEIQDRPMKKGRIQ
ncbi:hypothetical protein HMN09_00849700 [Mycena chlorophos]|uniref:BTB domain-containing protein n=1 Tax=Mycena chlorophos TaxID=658473 RepID=A0A8H6SS82_MYCCL|nr:hypothetical protein HMN09_00849700 [Mycena chlorophos]